MRLDPIPVVYYRRLGPAGAVLRTSGWGIVHRHRGHCVAYDFSVPPHTPHAVRAPGDGYGRVYLPAGAWINAIARYDHEGRLLYVRFDAATPPLWHRGACYQTDLYLDLDYDHASGACVVRDEEEFADEVASGAISARWAAAAHAAIEELAGLAGRGALLDRLAAWCPAPLVPNEGLRTTEVARGVVWPADAPQREE